MLLEWVMTTCALTMLSSAAVSFMYVIKDRQYGTVTEQLRMLRELRIREEASSLAVDIKARIAEATAEDEEPEDSGSPEN